MDDKLSESPLEGVEKPIVAKVIDPHKAIEGTEPGSDLQDLLGWAGTGDVTVAVVEEGDGEKDIDP